MVPLAFVEHLDVPLNRRFGVSPCGVALMINYLVLEATPEALQRRIVIAISLACYPERVSGATRNWKLKDEV